MYHAIRALVGSERLFRHESGGFPGLHFAVVAPLPQGFTLVLVTQAMSEDVEDLVGEGGVPYPELRHFSGALERGIEERTRTDPIAYFETHYVGEVGTEAAAVWHHGRLVLGPLHLERPTFRDTRADSTAPVCAALNKLGVRHRPGRDAFDALGLARFASMP